MARSAEISRTVLVVDDDDDLRETVADVLEDAGYCVLQAADGREALARLDELNGNPCLVLLDMMMPGMNGAELLETLRAAQRLAALPVVAFSANVQRAPGTRGFLRKPASVATLLHVVEEFCGGA